MDQALLRPVVDVALEFAQRGGLGRHGCGTAFGQVFDAALVLGERRQERAADRRTGQGRASHDQRQGQREDQSQRHVEEVVDPQRIREAEQFG